jgi:hypothetical protein
MPARTSIQNTHTGATFRSRPAVRPPARKWSARRTFLVVVISGLICWSVSLYFLYFLVRRMF